MKLNIIKIGNSLGIRIPKSLIKQCDFKELVQVTVKNKVLMLSAEDKNPRAGWAEAFKKMAQAGDDNLLEPMSFEIESDRKDWKW